MKILARVLFSILGILLAAYLVPGIYVAGVYTALIVAIVLGLLNMIVRPILFVLTLPITILTFGLFTFVLNGLLLWFVGTFIEGFEVRGLLPAILGALVISIVSWIGNHLLKEPKAA